MALFWTAKAASDIYRYTWSPALAAGDSLSAYTLTATGAVVDYEVMDGQGVLVVVSGGTAGQTAEFAFSADTTQGETLTETVYLPIIASTAIIADTARDYVHFALRKVTGLRGSVTAAELDDALERLNAIVASWRATGGEIGAPFPITANSVIYCPDYAVSALRHALLIECLPLYGMEPTQIEYETYRRGLQLVKQKNLPEVREAAFF